MPNSNTKDRLDFSQLERLTPRADSWDKVCARLDAEIDTSPKDDFKNNIIPFKLLSAIPLAASIALVALSVLMTAFSQTSETVTINNVTSTEIASWYNRLDSFSESENQDDFETLDNYATLSYLLQEERK